MPDRRNVHDDLPIDDSVQSSHLRNETDMQLITFDEGQLIRTNKYFEGQSLHKYKGKSTAKERNILKTCLNQIVMIDK